ncbi:MAG TPA: ribonucleoside-diphosphate reductase subunit alpha [Acidimicrobiales bacterium]|nr:ribonucleoside-diphosphate reductase subunit alpha [Acidimicrobiales bacterium]
MTTTIEAQAETAAPGASAGDPGEGGSPMRVRKRNGTLEAVDVNKIVRAVARSAEGLEGVDPMRVATRTISGLCDGATSTELDELSIRAAAALVCEEPNYSRLAARLLSTVIDKEVRASDVHAFSQSVALGERVGLIAPGVAAFVVAHRRKLDDAVDAGRDRAFEFFGLRTLYDRYLLRHPEERSVIETPQYFLLRVACGLAESAEEAIELYGLMSRLEYLPSSPTLFNSGTTHPQMSSCYLLDSPLDELESIYERYGQIAQLSKFAGGIGFAFHRVRSRGSLIRGTNGLSNGVVPWLKTLDASVAAVNQGGRRKGAACVYLESWHADIEDFLELRDNTGDEGRRAHTINLANWVPDLFMERVEQDFLWSLFDPKEVPELCDRYGEEFREAYLRAEGEGRFVRQLPARELYARMMRTLAQTGNGWMTFKDRANALCNQTARPGAVVHLSNLCTEILEVTSGGETAVCNLGSVNLGRFVADGGCDLERLGAAVRAAVTYLDRVVDINYYPTPESAASNARWRPVGIGMMGLQDVFFSLRLPFDSEEARALSARLAEEIYFNALWRSSELAEASGPHPAWPETRTAEGLLQCDLWGVEPSEPERWTALRERVARHGLRNSLLVAVAPTSTIASIANCYETIEPQVSNLFKRETLSGEFLQVNTYLVRDLQERGLWNAQLIEQIKRGEGSIQQLGSLPEELRALYRTAWELPQKSLVDLAVARGPFVDQSQSLNLFVEAPNIGKLSSMYMYAWKEGLKTTYYLRSRPATRITQTTVEASSAPVASLAEAVACSLEDPEHCEACE